jgi:hypothetical protein
MWKLLPVGTLALALLPGCAKDNFQKLNYTASAVAGQYNYVSPKLDVVIFQDNSSSMIQPNAIVQSQLNGFLSGLQSSWDYRFIVLPLQSTQPIGSKYVVAADCSSVHGVANCLSPSQIGAFNGLGGNSGWITSIDSSIGSTDYGFQNMASNISALNNAGFLRQDAVVAMVVVSNGEDISGGVNYITRPDGSSGGIDYNGAQTIASFNSYYNWFKAMKAAVPLVRMYAAVSSSTNNNCYGGRAFMGERYMTMAQDLGGMSVDICSGSLNQVLNDFSGQLQTVTQVIAFNYIVLPDQPSHINAVYKNGQTIDPSNWKYVGYLNNQATSYYPASGNVRSGYMIQLLNGTDYKGSDQISVDYQK